MEKACIFDLDGTLIDTLDSLTFSINEMLTRLDLPVITRMQCREFIGNGARNLVERSIRSVMQDADEEFIGCAMPIFGEVFAQYCTYKIVAYDGILDLLQELKRQGYKLAILTNKPHERTLDIEQQFFGQGLFDFVQGQCEGIPRKPDPSSLEYVIEKLRVPKETCIYVGDSEVDIETGIAAGVITLGVTWGFRDRSVLEAAQATYVFDEVEEVINFIDNMDEIGA